MKLIHSLISVILVGLLSLSSIGFAKESTNKKSDQLATKQKDILLKMGKGVRLSSKEFKIAQSIEGLINSEEYKIVTDIYNILHDADTSLEDSVKGKIYQDGDFTLSYLKDEFDYIIDENPEIVPKLKKVLDRVQPKKRLKSKKIATDVYNVLAKVDDDIKNDLDVKKDLIALQKKEGITYSYLKEEFGDVIDENPEIEDKLKKALGTYKLYKQLEAVNKSAEETIKNFREGDKAFEEGDKAFENGRKIEKAGSSAGF